jgi:ABC-type nickel/cobalt efflux system permease component RcnA
MAVTAACGFGHVTVSVLLGLLGLVFGLRLLQMFGERMEAVAGLLLVGFGVVYGLLGLRRAASDRMRGHLHGQTHVHEHGHAHGRAHGHGHPHVHVRDLEVSPGLTAWTLFLLFSVDPCVAVVPVLFAAAPLGALQTLGIVALYELATIGTMVLLVAPASAAARAVRAEWLSRYSDAAAGGIIVFVGLAVTALGW